MAGRRRAFVVGHFWVGDDVQWMLQFSTVVRANGRVQSLAWLRHWARHSRTYGQTRGAPKSFHVAGEARL